MEGFGIKVISAVSIYRNYYFSKFFEKPRRGQIVLQDIVTSSDKCEGLIKKLILQVSS